MANKKSGNKNRVVGHKVRLEAPSGDNSVYSMYAINWNNYYRLGLQYFTTVLAIIVPQIVPTILEPLSNCCSAADRDARGISELPPGTADVVVIVFLDNTPNNSIMPAITYKLITLYGTTPTLIAYSFALCSLD